MRRRGQEVGQGTDCHCTRDRQVAVLGMGRNELELQKKEKTPEKELVPCRAAPERQKRKGMRDLLITR